MNLRRSPSGLPLKKDKKVLPLRYKERAVSETLGFPLAKEYKRLKLHLI